MSRCKEISRRSDLPVLARKVQHPAAGMLHLLRRLAICVCVGVVPSRASAQQHAAPANVVRCCEVLPALCGTAHGELPIMQAPPPGATLVVHGSDIRRALASHGVSARGLDVPRSTRVTRTARTLPAQSLASEALPTLRAALAPCEVQELLVRAAARIGAGAYSLSADLPSAPRSGLAQGSLVITSAATQARVPLQVTLQCPEPTVLAGRELTLRAVVGGVVASAPGEARQAGRAGDVIRVRNRATGAELRARIVDASSAEVVR